MHSIFSTADYEYSNLPTQINPNGTYSKARTNFSFNVPPGQKNLCPFCETGYLTYISLWAGKAINMTNGEDQARTGQRARTTCPGISAPFTSSLYYQHCFFPEISILPGRNPKENSNKPLTMLSTETKS